MKRVDRVLATLEDAARCEPVALVMNACMNLVPEDEQGKLFCEALRWVLGRLIQQSLVIAAHRIVPPPRRYAEKVQELIREVEDRIAAEVGCDVCPQTDCAYKLRQAKSSQTEKVSGPTKSCPYAAGVDAAAPSVGTVRGAAVIPFPVKRVPRPN